MTKPIAEPRFQVQCARVQKEKYNVSIESPLISLQLPVLYLLSLNALAASVIFGRLPSRAATLTIALSAAQSLSPPWQYIRVPAAVLMSLVLALCPAVPEVWYETNIGNEYLTNTRTVCCVVCAGDTKIPATHRQSDCTGCHQSDEPRLPGPYCCYWPFWPSYLWGLLVGGCQTNRPGALLTDSWLRAYCEQLRGTVHVLNLHAIMCFVLVSSLSCVSFCVPSYGGELCLRVFG